MLVRFELKWEMKRLGGGKPLLLLISLILKLRELSKSYNMRHNFLPLTKPWHSTVLLMWASLGMGSSSSADLLLERRFLPNDVLEKRFLPRDVLESTFLPSGVPYLRAGDVP